MEAKQPSFRDGLYILRFSRPLADSSPGTLGYGLGALEKEHLRTCVQSTGAGLSTVRDLFSIATWRRSLDFRRFSFRSIVPLNNFILGRKPRINLFFIGIFKINARQTNFITGIV